MRGAPRVSVFIPVRNREGLIATAVDSILAQTYTDFELLVVDDGSTDATVRVLEAYRDPRLRIETNGAHRGIPATRNRGLELARGEYLALLDSDDYAYPGRLARQLRYLDRHPQHCQVGTWCSLMDAGGRLLPRVRRQPCDARQIKARLLFHCPLINRTLMARTEVLRRFRYSEAFPRCQDYDLHARLSAQHTMVNLPQVLTCGREHVGRYTGATEALGEDRKMAIQGRLLEDLGVPWDAADLQRHYLLTRARKDPHAGPEYLDWAESWLQRLAAANRRSRCHEPAVFEGVLAQVWAVACWRTRQALGWRWALRLARSPLARCLPGQVDAAAVMASMRPTPRLRA